MSTAAARQLFAAGAESTKTAVVLAVLFAICCLGINRDLWTPDEPREAEISREMLLAPGIVPTLNGEAFIEKPPLYYWTVAAVFKLTGQPSATAARSVSVVASFLTLLIVFLWGRREFSTDTGLIAALGLATSTQFMISSHWVLIDPMLMLFTTLAAWAGWDLVRGRGGLARVLQFYAALAIALWIKGLIGPVMIAAGLLAYAGAMRSFKPILRVRPFIGGAAMLAATAMLAWLIYADGGRDAVREWFWVNHVERFIDPDYTGHEQPFYYYLSAVPIAIFPWLLPFVDCLRPSRWRSDKSSWKPAKVYCGALSLGMVLILSASATKRGIYLLPMLPPLFLLLAAQAVQWWQRQAPQAMRSAAWWLQIALVSVLAAGIPILGMIVLATPDPLAVGFLCVWAALMLGLIIASHIGNRHRSLVLFGAHAVSGVLGLMVVAAALAKPDKDMSPFVSWVDAQLPPGEPVYVLGNIDETVYGVVPFVTGREVVRLSADEIAAAPAPFILVQDKNGGATAAQIGSPYTLVRERVFGQSRFNSDDGRYFALWQRAGKPGSGSSNSSNQ